MHSPTASLTLDQWQILFHETMAVLLRAQSAVKQQFGMIGILNGLWRASRDLKKLNASMRMLSEVPDGTLGDNFFQSQVPQVRKLLRSIDELLDTLVRHGWTNRSLTNASIESIRNSGEYVADYLDGLEMAIDPEVLRAIDEGRKQIEAGEFEEMERLF